MGGMALNEHIAATVKRLRKQRGWSLDDLGENCSPPTTPQQIYKLEEQQVQFKPEWIERVAPAFGLAAWELVRGEPEPLVTLSESAARLAAAAIVKVLQGNTLSPEQMDIGGLFVQELFGMFAESPATRDDPQALAPALRLLSRQFEPRSAPNNG